MGNIAEYNNSNFHVYNPDGAGWTMLYNQYVILNKGLSPQEKNMIAVFAALGNHYDLDKNERKKFYKQDVYIHCQKSPTTNDKVFKSLKQKGHIRQVRVINQDDNTLDWRYDIFQKPLDVPVVDYITLYIYEGKTFDAPQVVRQKVKKAPDTILETLKAKYPDIDPSVLANIAADLTATDTPQEAKQEPKQQQQGQKTYYETLCNDKEELNKVILKYEITEEELGKHLENFRTAKTAHHVSYESYHQHFSNYVGKSLEAVKKVVKHRQKETKKLSPPKYTKQQPTDVATLKDEELLEKARELYKGIDPSQGWEQYRNNTDAFIRVTETAQQRGIQNPKLYEELQYFKQVRQQAGGLKLLFEKEQNELTEKTKPPEDG